MTKMRVVLCGFGGLGHVHANSLATMPDVDLVAVCDTKPERLAAPEVATNLGSSGSVFDIRASRTYADFRQMLTAERPDLVVTALPTDLHAPYAILAFEAGCHVFSEKPMALTYGDAGRMIEAARQAGRQLMIGQCLRFKSEYANLREMVRDGRYGRLCSMTLERIGAYPRWSDWFTDHRRSGGAILDLHLHDVDWCLHALGRPDTVVAGGRVGPTGGIDDVTAVWEYVDGPLVTLRSSWLAHGFHANFRALFERAVVECGFAPEGGLVVTPTPEGGRLTIPSDGVSAYFAELRYFIDRIRDGAPNRICPPESTCETVRMVELERESIAAGRVVRVAV